MALARCGIIGVIPARLESERLPRKALRAIAGHPMLVWVWRRAREARALEELLVATDSQEIAACCRSYSIPVELTRSAHRSGTDRIIEVMERRPAEIYVNIQGDEPMVTAEHIELLLAPFGESPPTLVSTLKVPISAENARDHNNTKVVTDLDGRALYFSRAPIPYDRDPAERDPAGRARYFKHLGFYAYRAAALEKFRAFAPSPLEQSEKLEQLRYLEHGIPIVVVETARDTIGVDTPQDLARVEEYFRRTGATLILEPS
jgi:3-deoxy-manno-octulosonate cytidylyltransferase (CMP-KDO synthetase)